MVEVSRDVAPQISDMLGQPGESRIRFIMQDRWIDYTRATEIMDEMNYLLRQPVRARMEGMLMISHTNNGKTALVKKFIRSNQNSIDGKFAYVETPARSTLKMFFSEVLEVLGIPVSRGESTVDLQHKILHSIKQLNIRMLFVDEIHNMLESRKENVRDVLNGLKGLSNQAEIPIVLIGTECAAGTIYFDEQVANRFPAWELPRWEFNAEFRDFLHTFEMLLPLNKESNLASKELAREIFERCDGLIGDAVKILVRSSEWAVRSGVECITKDILRKIGERINGQRRLGFGQFK